MSWESVPKFLKNWLFCIFAVLISLNVFARTAGSLDVIAVAELPHEAQATLALIQRGGPFPYAKDGSIFGNYEGILPKRSRGYYREFTVKTPGKRSRGARRIIAGGNSVASADYYYTDDHYATFKHIKYK
jgi:ribonuclease T1